MSWKATSSHLPELLAWPDGPVTGPAGTPWDGLGPHRGAPRHLGLGLLAGPPLPSGPRRQRSRGSPGPAPGGNPRTGPRAARRAGGGRGVPSIKASSEARAGQGGPRAPALGDCLPATLGGLGGCLGLGSWPPAAHVALPSEPGAGRTSAPTARKLLMRAWRPGPNPVRQPGAKDHPCLGQCPPAGPGPRHSACFHQGPGWWCSWRWYLSHQASAAHQRCPAHWALGGRKGK